MLGLTWLAVNSEKHAYKITSFVSLGLVNATNLLHNKIVFPCQAVRLRKQFIARLRAFAFCPNGAGGQTLVNVAVTEFTTNSLCTHWHCTLYGRDAQDFWPISGFQYLKVMTKCIDLLQNILQGLTFKHRKEHCNIRGHKIYLCHVVEIILIWN